MGRNTGEEGFLSSMIAKLLRRYYFPRSLGNNAYSKLPKAEIGKRLSSLDLLVVDIDDTIAPHYTVGIANRIFLDCFFRCFFDAAYKGIGKIETTKDALKIVFRSFARKRWRLSKETRHWRTLASLAVAGTHMYFCRFVRNRNNFLDFWHISNEHLIKRFISVMKRNNIHFRGYFYSKQELKRSLYPGVQELFLGTKKLNPRLEILCMSQSFSEKNGGVHAYASLIPCSSFHSNRVRCKEDGTIASEELSIPNAKAKRKIVERQKCKQGSIGILANEYEDRELIGMPNVTLCILNNAPVALWKKGHVLVDKDYGGLC